MKMHPTTLCLIPPLITLVIAFILVSRYNRKLGIIEIDGSEIWSDQKRLIRCIAYAIPAVIITAAYWWIMEAYNPTFVVAGTMAGFLFGVAIWHILYYSLEIRPLIMIGDPDLESERSENGSAPQRAPLPLLEPLLYSVDMRNNEDQDGGFPPVRGSQTQPESRRAHR